jgi:hypothetical protein
MLQPSDEFAHQPLPVTNWQENYVWHAWDPATRSGWNLHLGNISDEKYIDVRGHVIIRGNVTACSFQEPGADCLGVTGLDADIRSPFEEHRLQFAGHGSAGPDAGGWFGRGAGDVPFGFDVDIVSEHQAFDANAFPEMDGRVDLPGTGNHYELGARWRGRLWSGAEEITAAGLLVRDHSWGGRVWTWDESFWLPMVFDEGREFVFNVLSRTGSDWFGLSVAMNGDGMARKTDELWVRLDGPRVPRLFGSAQVLMAGDDFRERVRYEGGIHLPVGRARSRVGLSDMYSAIYANGSDRAGFSTVQTFPTEEEVLRGLTNALPQFR